MVILQGHFWSSLFGHVKNPQKTTSLVIQSYSQLNKMPSVVYFDQNLVAQECRRTLEFQKTSNEILMKKRKNMIFYVLRLTPKRWFLGTGKKYLTKFSFQ